MLAHLCSLDQERGERERENHEVKEQQLDFSATVGLWWLWERQSQTWRNKNMKRESIVLQSEKKTQPKMEKALKVYFTKPTKLQHGRTI